MGWLRSGKENASRLAPRGHTAIELFHLYADEVRDPSFGRKRDFALVGLAKCVCR